MSLFKRHTQNAPEFPREEFEPVIRSSICTGEKVACMRQRSTGRLREVMLLRGEDDLEIFCRRYGLKKEEIKTIY